MVGNCMAGYIKQRLECSSSKILFLEIVETKTVSMEISTFSTNCSIAKSQNQYCEQSVGF